MGNIKKTGAEIGDADDGNKGVIQVVVSIQNNNGDGKTDNDGETLGYRMEKEKIFPAQPAGRRQDDRTGRRQRPIAPPVILLSMAPSP
jgi:hypothetical protein